MNQEDKLTIDTGAGSMEMTVASLIANKEQFKFLNANTKCIISDTSEELTLGQLEVRLNLPTNTLTSQASRYLDKKVGILGSVCSVLITLLLVGSYGAFNFGWFDSYLKEPRKSPGQQKAPNEVEKAGEKNSKLVLRDALLHSKTEEILKQLQQDRGSSNYNV